MVGRIALVTINRGHFRRQQYSPTYAYLIVLHAVDRIWMYCRYVEDRNCSRVFCRTRNFSVTTTCICLDSEVIHSVVMHMTGKSPTGEGTVVRPRS